MEFHIICQEGKMGFNGSTPGNTYLSVSGARWLYHPDDAALPIEQKKRTSTSYWST